MGIPLQYVPTLQAKPDVLMIDVEAGQTSRTTDIEYSKEPTYAIWHRWRSGAWLRVSLQVTAPDDPAISHGYFTSPKLEPGWVYEVEIWDRGIDPNRVPNVDPRPTALASIVVFALKKRPERRQFFSDENQRTGGTYREHQIATTAPVHAYMAVSTDPPVTDSNGFMTFGRVDGYTWEPINQSFLLQITDLLPGNPYHELLRLSDAFGNWEFVSRDFDTLRRRIRLEPTDLFINDDGDDFSNGEGSFRFTVETWPDPTPGGTNTLTYSNGNLETGKSVTPVPGGTILLGPDRVREGTRNIRLSVSGTEDDSGSFPLTGDGYASAQKDLLVPMGTIDEVVSYRSDAITGSGVGDIRFTLSFKYWIEYF